MNPSELARLIGDSPFFSSLETNEQVELSQQARYVEYGPGVPLFQPHEAPSALYLVALGLVEISRCPEADSDELIPVAYLGPGATLAASRLITGTPFAALARFPEGGAVMQWSRAYILRLLYSSRDFSMQYLHNIARHLEGTVASLGASGGTSLDGRLDHFDLPTILQTVVESGATGLLEVLDEHGGRYGTIRIGGHRLGAIDCGTLSGPEAFLEILVTPPPQGSFTFASTGASDGGGERYDLAPLLLEAARIYDEYQRFKAEVPEDRRLGPAGREPTWDGQGPQPLELQLWQALAAQPSGWDRLAERLPFSRARVALTVRELLHKGLLFVEGS